VSYDLSVVICTWNRVHDLTTCLQALIDDLAGRDDTEVVIVDNNCTDGTTTVVRSLIESVPHFRLMSEETPGLARARNAGLAQTTGRVVAFLDDDAVVRTGWSDAVHRTFLDDSVDALGGLIVLRWPDGERPTWLPHRYDSYFTCLDLGPEPMQMPAGTYPFGANMAIARKSLQRGGFEESLGRKANSLLSSEEAHLFALIRGQNGLIMYEPRAAVDHIVPPSRVSRRWVVRRLYAQGTSDAIRARTGTRVGPHSKREAIIGLSLEARRTVAWSARVLIRARPHAEQQVVLHAGRLAYLCAWTRQNLLSQRRTASDQDAHNGSGE
jgi:glycosyltransferase involved in cell wall biosynthesis